MDSIFLKLLNMSIVAGWLILAVMVLRLLLKKAPKWLPCTLWAIVAIRLLCPFSLESSFSLIPSAETISPAVVRYAQEPTIHSGIPFINSTLNPIISQSFAPNPAASANPLYIWMYIASIIWVIGLLALLCYAFLSFWRIYRNVQEAVPLRDNIWFCDAVKSPFILGIIRPQIYLSSSTENEQIPYILAHEQAHLKRKDHWWKWLAYLLLAVYWFHPLVWVAYLLLCRDIELACDEKVIKDMDFDGKKAYSNTLLSCSMQKKLILACPLAFGEVSVKERVKTVLHYKKPTFWIISAAIVTCVVVAVCFLTNPKNNTFDVKIVIPAGSEEAFYYSDEEISPKQNKITLSARSGLGDTLIVLKGTEVKEENAYEPTYLTAGLPVSMDAEKGGWFRIGVYLDNPTAEDRVVFVQAKRVDIRISTFAQNETNHTIRYNERWYQKDDLSDETIEWLRWYHQLSIDGQMAVSYVPWDLQERETSNTIRYNNYWYKKEDLSDETIEWLRRYHQLSPEEQIAVNSVPWDLQELENKQAGSEIVVETSDANDNSAAYLK